MRFYSAILFALMTMVLPMAGVQQRFCTVSKAAACAIETCSTPGCQSCESEGREGHGEPVCMTSAKNLPHAQKSSPVEVPTLTGGWTLLLAAHPHLLPDLSSSHSSTARDRGPPHQARLFLTQLRLLI
jgi:hypothetical protein